MRKSRAEKSYENAYKMLPNMDKGMNTKKSDYRRIRERYENQEPSSSLTLDSEEELIIKRKKNGKLRLILDARLANTFFAKPPSGENGSASLEFRAFCIPIRCSSHICVYDELANSLAGHAP